MTLTNRQREIVESTEEIRNDIVETVSPLVRIRSVNPGSRGDPNNNLNTGTLT